MAAVLDEAIQTVEATQANIKELKPEQEECAILFIEGKYIVVLLPMGVIYQLALLVAK